MKILHSADWHLDSPLGGFSEEQAKFLRSELLRVPDRVAALCKSENCDLLLLAGDLFDGQYTQESLNALRAALEEVLASLYQQKESGLWATLMERTKRRKGGAA